MRRKQFHVLMYSIQEMQKLLEGKLVTTGSHNRGRYVSVLPDEADSPMETES